jgi:hypothetical protein
VERVGLNATTVWLAVLAVCLLLLPFVVRVVTSALLWRRISKGMNRGW